nr:MAG TPA: hypothetical protein [Caudoviricetes sp.]
MSVPGFIRFDNITPPFIRFQHSSADKSIIA